MLNRPHKPDNAIPYRIEMNYGIEIIRLLSLPWGADSNASVFKAIANNQKEYFVKLIRGHAQVRSYFVQKLMKDNGVDNIILPIFTNKGHASIEDNDTTIVVYPFIHGENGFNKNLALDQWRTFGKILRHIHDIDVPLSIQKQISHTDYTSRWRKAVRDLYKLKETIQVQDQIAKHFQLFIKENASLIHQLVERAEQLARKIKNQSFSLVLCHGDLHGGNILIDKDGTLYIIDWDNPCMAPKERDLMFIGGGVGNVWNQPHEVEAFFEGYGKTEINSLLLSYFRCERIVQDVAEYAQQILYTSAPHKKKSEAYQHFISQFASNGVIEIALKIDDPCR